MGDLQLELTPSEAAVDVDVPMAAWAPIRPEVDTLPERVVLTDGVRRGRVWIHVGRRRRSAASDGASEP